jgi:hypothetical protein
MAHRDAYCNGTRVEGSLVKVGRLAAAHDVGQLPLELLQGLDARSCMALLALLCQAVLQNFPEVVDVLLLWT